MDWTVKTSNQTFVISVSMGFGVTHTGVNWATAELISVHGDSVTDSW